MNGNAVIFDQTQLQIAEICREALKKNLNASGSKLPADTPNQLVARPRNFFIRKFVGGDGSNAGDKTFNLFDKAADASKPFESNFTETQLSGGKFLVIFGVQLRVATGAAAGTDDQGTMDYQEVVEPELVNGLVKFHVNRDEPAIQKDTPIGPIFTTGDVIPGLYRLPSLAVWRPDNSLDFELKLAKAFGATTYKYVEVVLWGIELSK